MSDSHYTMPDPLSAASSYYEAPEKENYASTATQKRALRRDASNGSSSALSSLFESVADRDSTFLPSKSVLSNSYSSLSEFSIIRPAQPCDSLEKSPKSTSKSSGHQSSRYSSGISRRGINSSAEIEGLELEVTRGESPFARWEMAMQPQETAGYVSFHGQEDFKTDEDIEQTKANIDPKDLVEDVKLASVPTNNTRSFLQQRSIRYLIKASIFFIALSTFIKPLDPNTQITGDPVEPEDLVDFTPLPAAPEVTPMARTQLPTPTQTLLSLSQYLIVPCLVSIASLVLLYYLQTPKTKATARSMPVSIARQANEHHICIHGARESGKSSILHQQVFSSPNLTATRSRRITYTKNSVVVGLTIHDALTEMLSHASVVLLVFSLMDRASLEFVREAIPHFAGAEVVLVGNKLDLVTPASNAIRVQARKLAENEGMQYFEVSAVNGSNVSEMFRTLARQLRNA